MLQENDIIILQKVTNKIFGKDWYTFYTDLQTQLIYEAGSIEKHLDNMYSFFVEEDKIDDANDMLLIKNEYIKARQND